MTLEKFAIAIPTYNEAKNIARLVPIIAMDHPNAQIFVIDDSSPDGTAEIVENLSQTHSNVFVIRHGAKNGLAKAYLDGFQEIIQDDQISHIITMDADFSHDPQDLKKLIAAAANHDIVVGSRYVPGGMVDNWNMRRRLLSKFGNTYAQLITGLPITDLTAGFVAYHRDIITKILNTGVKAEGYAYQIEMKYLAMSFGASVAEVPITFIDRTEGKSKLNQGVVREGIITPWILRFKNKNHEKEI